jgi:hypothetical protein
MPVLSAVNAASTLLDELLKFGIFMFCCHARYESILEDELE